MKSFVVILIILLAAPLVANDDVCKEIPLLQRYFDSELARWINAEQVEILLRADLHAADCSAPDCYGTDLVVNLQVVAKDQKCTLLLAKVRSTPFQREGCELGQVGAPVTSEYTSDFNEIDLGDSELRRVDLYSESTAEAVVILAENFFYFDSVSGSGELRTYLDPGDGLDSGCCWGASSSKLTRFASNVR